jgi:hypothetical protein
MNQIDQNITVGMVKRFQIHENYQQRFPGSHTCKIALVDGRKIKRHIDGPEIYIIIQAIAKEKIGFKRSKDVEELSWEPQTLDHFNCYKDFPYSAFKLDKSIAPSPDELLSSLFSINNFS